MSDLQIALNTSTPTPPPVGFLALYSKIDGKWYQQDSNGIESLLDSPPLVSSVAGKTGAINLVKADVGLASVNNTSDANKPVSTRQQAALDAKLGVVIPALAVTKTANAVTKPLRVDVADWHPAARKHWLYGTHRSWNTEALNTATRGSKMTGPAKFAVVLELSLLSIYDLTEPSAPLWRSRTVIGASSAAMLNGVLVIVTGTGLVVDNYILDSIDNAPNYTTATTPAIVNNTVNSVAITTRSGAPLDNNGVPKPTIAAFTDGGPSIIHNDGTVANLTYTEVMSNSSQYGGFTTNGGLWYGSRHIGTSSVYVLEYTTIPQATTSAAPDALYTVISQMRPNVSLYILNEAASNTVTTELVAGKYIGNPSGLTIIHRNPTTPANGMVAYINSLYNTGYMVGDIRRCVLANVDNASLTLTNGTVIPDRSVKNSTGMTVVGTITQTVNAGGVNVYSGFSAANYFSEASHADWNALGTGDFSIIMSGVKWGTAGTSRGVFTWGDGITVGSIGLFISTANKITLYIHNGASYTANSFTVTQALTDTAEHVLVMSRTSGTVSFIVDGMLQAGTLAGSAALTVSNSAGALLIGNGVGALAAPWTGGQVRNVRISATVPTAEQSLFIAQQENALNGGTLALLSADAVTALDYNKKADLLSVETAAGYDYVNGLRVVNKGVAKTDVTDMGFDRIQKDATHVYINTPAISVREALEADAADTVRPTVLTKLTAVGTTLTFPKGFTPIRVNAATGTYVSLSTNTPQFDGFLYSLQSGVINGTVYDVEMKEVA